MANTNVTNFLLGNTRAAVLRTLLLQPDTALHVRELARVTGASPGSLHRDLRTLTALGLLLREAVGHQVHYRANSACPVFEALTGLLRDGDAVMPAPQTHTPDARVLHSPAATYRVKPREKLHIPRGQLAALCRKYHIRKLSLFGSAARNEMSAASDVDLLIEFEPGNNTSLLEIPALQEELSALFGGRKVDVATPEILDNPFRRKTILPELMTLYADGSS
ncbi:MAG: nucleotidyltransferase domain-containing protein [Burkholderiales bacterium]|nr:nucleotidyltransferase domain-containing protein [Burkholderiales bacterium]